MWRNAPLAQEARTYGQSRGVMPFSCAYLASASSSRASRVRSACQSHYCYRYYSLSGTGAQYPVALFFLESVGLRALPRFFCLRHDAARRLGGNDLGERQHSGPARRV